MNKKILSTVLIASIIAVSSSFTAFAAMPNGTVVIGNKAFDLGYANDSANFKEITSAIVAGGTIYVKGFSGNWIDNITGENVQANIIPAVVYKSSDKQINFATADQDESPTSTVVSVITITDTKNIGESYTLPSTVNATLSNGSTRSLAVTWDKVADTKVAGEFTFKGTLSMIDGILNSSNITVVAKLIVVDNIVTINNKKGYVYNSELEIDLKVRSAPNLNGTILGYLYNYEKIEILDTIIDNSGQWYKIAYNNNFAYVNKAYIQSYTTPPDNVVDIAVNITNKFEVGTSNQIAGNFDGQGLSLGYFQWCIGQGTLQPLVNRMDRQYNSELKSIFSTNYNTIHSMLLDTKDNQLKWAISINDPANKILEPWYSQFVSLSDNVNFKNIEADAEVYSVSQAMRICDKYNLKTVRGFALALDITVQNGSISSGATTIIDNALKQTPNMEEKTLLGIIANAVADTSPANSEDIRSRKISIVNGQGTVHGSMLYLDANYKLSDANWR